MSVKYIAVQSIEAANCYTGRRGRWYCIKSEAPKLLCMWQNVVNQYMADTGREEKLAAARKKVQQRRKRFLCK